MSLEEYYRPDTPNVIHEIIDGEAVMINMEKGYYYSMDHIGSSIWDLLNGGTAVSQIAILLQQQYSGSQAEIEAGVQGFLIELLAENLIVPAVRTQREEGAVERPAAGTGSNGAGQEKIPFAAPVLHKYTDMEDLLMLDPIHEVDETGWPAVPGDG